MVLNTSACRNVDMCHASVMKKHLISYCILIKRGVLYINRKIGQNSLKIMDSNLKIFFYKKYYHVLYFNSDSDSLSVAL